MQIQNKRKHPVLFGTLLLSFSGILCKIIGFFYKIFLSRTIGTEGLGIYHLIFPISTICFAITVAGLSTALTKYIAEYREKDPASVGKFLRCCLFFSTLLSLAATGIVTHFSSFIAKNILLEERCAPLIRILALSIPLSSLHACIHGYYYGKKQAAIPAISSLVEQSIRVFFVFLAFQIQKESGGSIDTSTAVWGLVVGEGASFLFCITALMFSSDLFQKPKNTGTVKHPSRKLLLYAIPLSTNRLTLTLFSSFESILIPSRLRLFGYTQTDALSIYGVLTGMALSAVLFPTVFTNSISVMILPTISEADSRGDYKKIHQTIRRTILGCLLLGSVCTFALLLSGKWIGQYLFCNSLAGKFIVLLSFICPFMFLSSILSSILHGLGFPGYPFLINLCGSIVRILFVYALIPVYGLKAYLMGMLCSQMLTSLLSVVTIMKKRKEII
ncbi:MAG: polysaccharide biosynthesis protein [Lachnospiraceae bacterium]|nr:polysaccharide biosynthesis protein [Lachnospiraceae bacterium]